MTGILGLRLNRERLPMQIIISLCIILMLIIISPWFNDDTENYLNTPAAAVAMVHDFIYHWTFARMAAGGEGFKTYFEIDAKAALQAYYPQIGSLNPNFYPPMHMLMLQPLARMDLVTAWRIFEFISILLFMLGVALLAGLGPLLLTALLAPMLWFCYYSGQNSILIAALYMVGFSQLERRPLLAGLPFGLLIFKPHFWILLLPWLLFMRHYRAFAVTLTVAMAFILTSLAYFSGDVWIAYFKSLPNYGKIMHHAGLDELRWYSLFGALRLSGLQTGPAMVLHLASAGLAILAAAWVGRSNNFNLSVAAYMMAMLLLSPYLFDYDLVISIVPAVLIIKKADRTRMSWANC